MQTAAEHAAKVALYRREFPERIAEASDRYAPKAKARYEASCTLELWPPRILKTLRQRAKNKGLDFNLVATDILVPEFCPVLGIRLKINRGRVDWDSPSVDRIDNRYGYVKGNVRVISHRANRLRADATVDELLRVVADLKVIEAVHGST